jgi:purine-binding chemotaxis protein CheW
MAILWFVNFEWQPGKSMTTTVSRSSTHAAEQVGKHLTFVLGNEPYGIGVLKVREIIRMSPITVTPHMPEYIKGMINLRGKIIPVIDLRTRFALPKLESMDRACIVVVTTARAKGPTAQMGLVVDEVKDVVNIPDSEIEETPDFGDSIDTRFIIGIAKVNGAVITLLDIDCVIAGESLGRNLTESFK